MSVLLNMLTASKGSSSCVALPHGGLHLQFPNLTVALYRFSAAAAPPTTINHMLFSRAPDGIGAPG